MQSLLDGLVDFNRTQLGLGIHVDRRPGDLAEHCAGELEEVRAVYPFRVFELSVQGDCRGSTAKVALDPETFRIKSVVTFDFDEVAIYVSSELGGGPW